MNKSRQVLAAYINALQRHMADQDNVEHPDKILSSKELRRVKGLISKNYLRGRHELGCLDESGILQERPVHKKRFVKPVEIVANAG